MQRVLKTVLVQTMSRVSSAPVIIPPGVKVHVDAGVVYASAAKYRLSCPLPVELAVDFSSDGRSMTVMRFNDDADARSLHGLIRSLLNNNVQGLVTPWEKRLEIIGVGYQASLTAGVLSLSVGFADVVMIRVPDGVVCAVPDVTHINLSGPDKQLVGQLAANIRSVRPPEPYKGKGIRYLNEHVKRKSGKAFGS